MTWIQTASRHEEKSLKMTETHKDESGMLRIKKIFFLKETPSKDSSCHENVENVQMFPSADFPRLFHRY